MKEASCLLGGFVGVADLKRALNSHAVKMPNTKAAVRNAKRADSPGAAQPATTSCVCQVGIQKRRLHLSPFFCSECW